MQGEVAGAHLFSCDVEVEVERVDGVDLGEVGVADAALDRAAHPALLFLVAEAMHDVEGRQILLGRLREECRYGLGHAGEPEPAQLFDEQLDEVFVLHGVSCPVGGSPGSRVMRAAGSWS